MTQARAIDSQGDVPPLGHNQITATDAKTFVGRIERLLDDLASEKGEYMRKAKTIREDIALVLDEAKGAGLPKKELRAVIKARELERKADAVRDELEADAQETFDQIRLALGDLADTPLGGAVLERASI